MFKLGHNVAYVPTAQLGKAVRRQAIIWNNDG